MTAKAEAPLLEGKDKDEVVEWAAEIREAVEARKQAQERLKDRPQPPHRRSLMRRRSG